jgi:prolyl-tRNA synthetase
MDKSGALELLMPTIQPLELWAESGRGGYGDEMLRFKDRGGRDLLYGPTNEEVITDIFRKNIKSYKELPKNLYHIQWKFRDEIRPRFGVMRGREFLMKDAYSFDIDEKSAIESYNNMFRTYLKIFQRMELKAIPFLADTGLIGGNLSHEFQVLAKNGESQIYYDSEIESLIEQGADIEQIKASYAVTDEKYDENNIPIPKQRVKSARGIEVGHIFYLGDKYSKPLKALVQNERGEQVVAKMGCYGIGVSRLAGAILEAFADEKGAVLPVSVAPFKIIIVNLKPDNVAVNKVSDSLYNSLVQKQIEVLLDDKNDSIGSKLTNADLIGIPYQIIIGPKAVEKGLYEVRTRKTGNVETLTVEEILNRFI